MKKVLFVAVCFVLVSSVAMAQDYPEVEVFGGWSMQRTGLPYEDVWASDEEFEDLVSLMEDFEGFEADFESSRFLKKGFQASATFNMNEVLGVEASFRYHSGDVVKLDMLYDGEGSFDATLKGEQSNFAFLVGPHFTLRKHERLIPFAHVLFGVDRIKVKSDVTVREGEEVFGYFLDYLYDYEGIDLREVEEEETDSGFGMVLGGGVDLKVSDGFAIRLIQADYFLSKHHEDTLNNFDLAFGVVIRFGD